MAWTTPRTWTPGETVTASIMNTHVRDNLTELRKGVTAGCRVDRTTNQSFTTAVVAYMSYDTETLDTDGFWAIGTPTQIIIPAGFGGLYLVEARFRWDLITANNFRILATLIKTGAGVAVHENSTSTTQYQTHEINWVGNLADADWVGLQGYQNTGGSVNARGTAPENYLAVYRLGDTIS